MLVLGLGGGVIPRDMRHYFPDMEIDVVDIDPEIPQVAKEFFGFSEDDKLKVHVDDGRMFIKKQLRRDPVPTYVIISLDAFNGDYIPFHLMTKEFLDEVKGVLDDDGVVVANVFYSNRLFDAEFETFLDVFERCQAFYGLDSGNAMLVSGGSAAPVLSVKQAEERARQLAEKHNFSFDMVVVARRLDPNSVPDPDAKVLTDDRAPVNWLRNQETNR
jgi:spermidine synthase